MKKSILIIMAVLVLLVATSCLSEFGWFIQGYWEAEDGSYYNIYSKRFLEHGYVGGKSPQTGTYEYTRPNTLEVVYGPSDKDLIYVEWKTRNKIELDDMVFNRR